MIAASPNTPLAERPLFQRFRPLIWLAAVFFAIEFLTRLVLAQAYAASGDTPRALEQERWLAEHRGRAYIEFGAKAAIPYAVAQTNLALLRQAELNLAADRKDDARRALQAFHAAWPDAEQIPAIAARLKALSAP